MKDKWSRGDKIGLATVIITATGIAAAFIVPEVRQMIGLEGKPQETSQLANTSIPIPATTSTKVADETSSYMPSIEQGCVFYGSATRTSGPWKKVERCNISNADHIDTRFHQADFRCCDGGGKSNTTAIDIPAGLEIRTNGYGKWSVSEVKYDNGILSLTTHCDAEGSFVPCNVETDIYAHYK